MFDKSYFETLQDYLASGCTMELTDEELDYYNVLYALVGINRKYGKDNAVAFLMHGEMRTRQGRKCKNAGTYCGKTSRRKQCRLPMRPSPKKQCGQVLAPYSGPAASS